MRSKTAGWEWDFTESGHYVPITPECSHRYHLRGGEEGEETLIPVSWSSVFGRLQTQLTALLHSLPEAIRANIHICLGCAASHTA